MIRSSVLRVYTTINRLRSPYCFLITRESNLASIRTFSTNSIASTSSSSSSSTPLATTDLRARYKPWPASAMSRGDWSGALETYARYPRPQDKIDSEVYLTHDDSTLTIFDGFEKAKFHFLIMPRDPFTLPNSMTKIPSSHLLSVSKLLASPHCLPVLEALQVAADKLKTMIEDEMMKREGFIWPVQIGFHGSESMRHVHLHVISSDLISPKLKVKKHYNSFNPKSGFFLLLSEVIEDFKNGVRMPSSTHFEAILKEPLVSFYNGETYANIPKLKAHLETEWEKLRKEGRKKMVVEKE